MKKGNVWPYARARWMITDMGFIHNQIPVWAQVFEMGATFIAIIDDLPIPIFVSEADCSLGQWRYDPTIGRVTWKGTWEVLTLSGDWICKQTLRSDEFVDITFELGIVLEGFRDIIRFAFNIPQSHGLWSRSDDFTIYLRETPVVEYPWIAGSHCIMKPATYGELRSVGIDPDNTEPVTWNYVEP